MKPDILYYVLRWLMGFCEIIDGVCRIFTVGLYSPNLNLKVIAYSGKRIIKRALEK